MLVVEDGTGLIDADTYVSVAEADAYHLLYGNAAWVDIDAERKEVLLRRATRDLDIMFGSRYKGSVYITTQSLAWPRLVSYANSGISRYLKDAVSELALVEHTTDVLGPDDFSGNIKSTTKKVGALEKSVEYFGPTGSVAKNKMTKVYALMSGLLGTSSGHYVTLVR